MQLTDPSFFEFELNKNGEPERDFALTKWYRDDGNQQKVKRTRTAKSMLETVRYVIEEIIDLDNRRESKFPYNEGNHEHSLLRMKEFIDNRMRRVLNEIVQLNKGSSEFILQAEVQKTLEYLIRIHFVWLNELRKLSIHPGRSVENQFESMQNVFSLYDQNTQLPGMFAQLLEGYSLGYERQLGLTRARIAQFLCAWLVLQSRAPEGLADGASELLSEALEGFGVFSKATDAHVQRLEAFVRTKGELLTAREFQQLRALFESLLEGFSAEKHQELRKRFEEMQQEALEKPDVFVSDNVPEFLSYYLLYNTHKHDNFSIKSEMRAMFEGARGEVLLEDEEMLFALQVLRAVYGSEIHRFFALLRDERCDYLKANAIVFQHLTQARKQLLQLWVRIYKNKDKDKDGSVNGQ